MMMLRSRDVYGAGGKWVLVSSQEGFGNDGVSE